MRRHGQENPLLAQYDRLLKIARDYEVTLSLGDGLRPGSLADATDKAQLHELKLLGELTKRAWAQGVQVMVEGPGHLPLNAIQKNIRLQQKYCANAPFTSWGPWSPTWPQATTTSPGPSAGPWPPRWSELPVLCHPRRTLKAPDVNDVIEGVVASRIAAHAADIARGLPGAAEWDLAMSKARRALDWPKQLELSINPTKAKKYESCPRPGRPMHHVRQILRHEGL